MLKMHTTEPMTCTAPPKDDRPLSLATLTAAMREVGLLPNSNQWVVIDPNGRAYKGTADEMALILLQSSLMTTDASWLRSGCISSGVSLPPGSVEIG
jgi:hypothetical protein